MIFIFGRYLVGVSAAVAAHSFLQLLIGSSRFLRMSSLIPSRNHAWLIFAGDQVYIAHIFLRFLCSNLIHKYNTKCDIGDEKWRSKITSLDLLTHSVPKLSIKCVFEYQLNSANERVFITIHKKNVVYFCLEVHFDVLLH